MNASELTQVLSDVAKQAISEVRPQARVDEIARAVMQAVTPLVAQLVREHAVAKAEALAQLRGHAKHRKGGRR